MNQERVNRFIEENAQVILALAILACATSMEAVNIYRRTRYAYNQFTQAVATAPAVPISAYYMPFLDCYPREIFPQPIYPWPVDVLANSFPSLDPAQDTWRHYERFVDEHSHHGPDGNVWRYYVPDIDDDGQVCGEKIEMVE